MSELLDVAAVMKRYSLRDRRAARRLMDEVGAFKVASSLYVRAEDLLAYEQALIEARRGTSRVGATGAVDEQRRARNAKRRPARKVREPLPPDWWRTPFDGGGEGSLAPSQRMG